MSLSWLPQSKTVTTQWRHAGVALLTAGIAVGGAASVRVSLPAAVMVLVGVSGVIIMLVVPQRSLIWTVALCGTSFTDLGISSGDTTQRVCLLVMIVLCALRLVLAMDKRVGCILGFLLTWGLANAVGLWGFAADNDVLLRAVCGLALPWILISVRWPNSAQGILRVVAATPLLSAVTGLLLYFMGIGHALGYESGILRFGGAANAATLGMACISGVMASLLLMRMGTNRAYVMLLGNLIVVGSTVTRGAIGLACFLCVCFIVCVRIAEREGAARPRSRSMGWAGAGKGSLVLTLLVVVALSAGAVIQRNGRPGNEGINLSGRADAWNAFYRVAEERPLWGYYVGFSTQVREYFSFRAVDSGFVAPHNEYLHYWIDFGLLGALTLALLVSTWIHHRLKVLPGDLKNGATLAVLGVFIYAYADNPFSTLAGSCLMLLTLLSISRPDPQAAPAAGRPARTALSRERPSAVQGRSAHGSFTRGQESTLATTL